MSDAAAIPSSVSPIVGHHPGASNTADGAERQTAFHYGQPLVEQSSLDKPGTIGLFDAWDHRAIHITGEERLDWLNNLISQKVNAMQPGTVSHGLILDVQGRVEHCFGIAALEDRVILSTDMQHAEDLLTYLQRMIFWAKVEVALAEEACLSLIGVDPQGQLAGEGTPAEITVDGVHHWDFGALGEHSTLNLWVDRDSIIQVWDELVSQANPVGQMAADALRIAARIPDINTDLDDRTIPHEVPAFIGAGATGPTQLEVANAAPTDAAVHLNKGCYRGQETVSRVQNLGKPPRTLVLLHLDGSSQRLPGVGSDIQAGGKTIGRVGSSAHHSDLGPIALGLVKRNVVDKLAKDPQAVPPLLADDIDVAIDPDDVKTDDREAPGRAAIKRLRDTGAH